MKKFREYFIAHWFIQMKNTKFLIMEGAFIYMIFACAILTYGVLEFYDTVYLIPFLIPFAVGAYLVIWGPKVKDIKELYGYWRTQLRLLSDPKMWHVFNSTYDKQLEIELEEKWEQTYGQKWEDTQMVKLQGYQPLLLVFVCGLVALIYHFWFR